MAPIHLMETNSVGARCRHEIGPTGEAVKILFIGCSSAAGDNVSNLDRFSDVLEELIPRVVSHNYALSGSGHDQQLLIHREFASLIDPDVLVLDAIPEAHAKEKLTELVQSQRAHRNYRLNYTKEEKASERAIQMMMRTLDGRVLVAGNQVYERVLAYKVDEEGVQYHQEI